GYYGTLNRADTTTGTATQIATGLPSTSLTALLSVGDYLYATYASSGGTALTLTRIAKNGGAPALMAGSGAGHVDGVYSEARFTGLTGIATNGSVVYVADGTWLRRIRGVKRPVDSGGPSLFGETNGGSNPSESEPCNACYGHPIQTDTGALFETVTDLSVEDRGSTLSMARTYGSTGAATASVVGYGWAWAYGMNVKELPQSTTVVVSQENGSTATFTKQTDGTYQGASRLLATLVKNADGTWTFVRKQQVTMTFDAAGKITRQVARDGRVLSFTYNTAGKLTAVVGASGRALTFTYDVAGYLQSVAAPSGAKAIYAHDANGNLTTVTDPAGGLTKYGYDSRHLLTSSTNPREGLTINEFDSAARVVKQTQPLNRVWTFRYDDGDAVGTSTVTITEPGELRTVEQYVDGQLRSQTKAAGTADAATTRWDYDPVTSQPATVIWPDGASDKYTYDAAGNPLSHLDLMLRKTLWTYNDAGDLLSVTPPDLATTRYTYDKRGNQLTAETPAHMVTKSTYNADGALSAVARPGRNAATYDYYTNGDLKSFKDPLQRETTYAYDVDGRVQDVSDALQHTTHTTYDGAGRVKTITDAMGYTTKFGYYADGSPYSTTDAEGGISYTYRDAAGRLDIAEDIAGRQTRYQYDDAERLQKVTKPNGDAISYTYDGRGNKLSETTAAGTTHYTYDLRDRLLSTKSPGGHLSTVTYDDAGEVEATTDALKKTTLYAYDDAGRLLSTTDPLGRTTYSMYTLDGQLDTVITPDQSTIDYEYFDDGALKSVKNPDDAITTYTLNDAGQTVQRTLPGGLVTEYTYDEVGRLKTTAENGHTGAARTYDRAGRLTDLTYSDNTTPAVHYTYDKTGRRTSMTDGPGITNYVYDAAGRLKTAAGSAGSVGYDYDDAGQLTTLTYPSGEAVSYRYDNAGRMTAATDSNQKVTTFTWTSDGQLDTQTTPDGVVSDTDYNPRGAVTDITLAKGSATLAAFGYSYDDAGQLTGTTKPNGAHSYSYTANSQLGSIATTSGIGATGQYSVTPAGLLNGLPDGTTQRYDARQQLTTTTSPAGNTTAYGYDERGNRTSATSNDQRIEYGYNLTNRLTSFTRSTGSTAGTADTVEYTYDGDGLRASRTANGAEAKFVWATGSELPLLLDDGTHRYLYGPTSTPYAQVAADGTTEYLHTDQQGSVTHITNTEGDSTAAITYDPYGRIEHREGEATSNIGYTGAWTDDITALVYLRARDYDPATGQFLTVDPMVDETNQPYAYVENRPLQATDPTGLCWGCAWRDMWNDHELRVDVASFYFGARNALSFGADGWLLKKFANQESRQALCIIEDNPWYDRGATTADLASMAIPGGAPLRGALGAGKLIKGGRAAQKASRIKRINLPSHRTVDIDLDHVIKRHTAGGRIYRQSGNKTKFPDDMSPEQIESTIRQAYRNAEVVGRSQGSRRFLRGSTNGLEVEMWLDLSTRRIETAYPVWR
ncbi:RHS repeat-associated core domain-containing protein, partial [Nucisporomicrobium flavum]|uniref:RHS repeat-associated core domain-containing protein n=1 Tax=Nucisporomicrobium flavum TaxID=2785915 RepID=UPI0018F33C7A